MRSPTGPCKPCRRAYRIAYRATDRGAATHRRCNRAWRERHPEKQIASQQRWSREHPLKRWCENQVRSAIRSGRLTRLPCEICGAPKTHAHHEVYDRASPLAVTWLCPLHHKRRHAELRAAGRDPDATAPAADATDRGAA